MDQNNQATFTYGQNSMTLDTAAFPTPQAFQTAIGANLGIVQNTVSPAINGIPVTWDSMIPAGSTVSFTKLANNKG